MGKLLKTLLSVGIIAVQGCSNKPKLEQWIEIESPTNMTITVSRNPFLGLAKEEKTIRRENVYMETTLETKELGSITSLKNYCSGEFRLQESIYPSRYRLISSDAYGGKIIINEEHTLPTHQELLTKVFEDHYLKIKQRRQEYPFEKIDLEAPLKGKIGSKDRQITIEKLASLTQNDTNKLETAWQNYIHLEK